MFCNEDGYQILSGTSMSAPMVSGAVSLMLSVNPKLTNDRIVELLKKTAVPLKKKEFLGGVQPDENGGAGRLNVIDAVIGALLMKTKNGEQLFDEISAILDRATTTEVNLAKIDLDQALFEMELLSESLEQPDSGLIAHYEFNNGFVNEVTGNDDSALWQYGTSDIFSDGSLFLQSGFDHNQRGYASLNIDTSVVDTLTVEKRAKIFAKINTSQIVSVFSNEASSQELGVAYNHYTWNWQNDGREYFYLANVYVDEDSGLPVMPQMKLMDTRFDQWLIERMTIDYVNKRMTYTLTNDDGSNPETLTLESINFDRDENMLLRLNAWDWADGTEHIVDYLKISVSDSAPSGDESNQPQSEVIP